MHPRARRHGHRRLGRPFRRRLRLLPARARGGDDAPHALLQRDGADPPPAPVDGDGRASGGRRPGGDHHRRRPPRRSDDPPHRAREGPRPRHGRHRLDVRGGLPGRPLRAGRAARARGGRLRAPRRRAERPRAPRQQRRRFGGALPPVLPALRAGDGAAAPRGREGGVLQPVPLARHPRPGRACPREDCGRRSPRCGPDAARDVRRRAPCRGA